VADLRSRDQLTRHRFFLPPDSFDGSSVRFPPEVARQVSRVLRLAAGDEVIALDGSGAEYVVRLTSTGTETCGDVVTRAETMAEPSHLLTLYAALLKGSKYETVLQKCTEIGVSRFVPVMTERAISGAPSADRLDRWRAIVREAAEQSGRGRVPEVLPAVTYHEAVTRATHDGVAIALWEDELCAGLDDLPPFESNSRISLIVGPEGGLSESEARAAREHGTELVSLGPRILRAETASIVGAALLLARAGEMRPIG
jgi:16S rRNA (uracil1498-N3)-methyltransferase